MAKMSFGSCHKTQFQERKYLNWVKGGLALKYLKDGIGDFADEVVKDEHSRILQTLRLSPGSTCNLCSLKTLKPKHAPAPKVKQCPLGQRSCNCLHSNTSSCPNNICDRIYDEIVKSHGTLQPFWKNTDITKWTSHPWEIAKCFINVPGYERKQSANDTDVAGLLHLFVNCTFVQGHISSSNNLFDKIREWWNSVFHSPSMELEDQQLTDGINDIITLLEDEKELKAKECSKQAVLNITNLQQKNFIITTETEAEVCREALASLTLAINELWHARDEIMEDIKLKKDEALKKVQETAESRSTQLHLEFPELRLRVDNHVFENLQTRVKEIENEVAKLKQAHAYLMEHLREIEQLISTNTVFTEPTIWEKVLILSENEDISLGEALSGGKYVPSLTQLNELQKQFLETKSRKTSNYLKQIEKSICQFVTSKDANIKIAWLAYTMDKNDDVSVQLIIELKDSGAPCILEDFPYKVNCMQHNSFSQEAKMVLVNTCQDDILSVSDLTEIKHCINKNAKNLLENHKHLSIIDASPVRSRGFGSNEHQINPERCIVLYVRKKGFIPIGEEPFQTKYDGFQIDVREGAFYASMMAETDESLKIGNTIAKRIEQDYKYGTLGGFIEHPQYGLCGLTCAHVLLNDIEMVKLEKKGELSMLDFSQDSASVYLYNGKNHIKIGRLVKAILAKGNENSHGIDAAIFQIEKFLPVSGIFFDGRTQDEDPVHFDSGKAYKPSMFSADLKVFKYGSATGKTTGQFLKSHPVTTVKIQADQFPANLVMHNQIEIKSINNTMFSDKGDSGSLVMMDGHNDERFCIGIVEGITSFNTTIVTPIGQILDNLSVSSLKCFETDKVRESISRLDARLERVEQTLTEILSAVSNRWQCVIQ